MPRSFDIAVDYEASVGQVLRAFHDEQYWLARLADSGADDTALDSLQIGQDGGVAVATTQVLRRDRLPAVVTQLHRGDLRIQRREKWSPVTAGRASATVNGAIPGAPVSLTGTGVLAPKGSGCRLEYRVSVEVRIPLLGGKVETLIGGQLVELVIAEQRFTTTWLAEQSG